MGKAARINDRRINCIFAHKCKLFISLSSSILVMNALTTGKYSPHRGAPCRLKVCLHCGAPCRL